MKKILVNLKDWFDLKQNIDFASGIEGLNITVFPSLPYLYIYRDKDIKIGSQKISSFDEGAHTGSICAKHLKDFNVRTVILNHKECKIYDIDTICNKVTNAKKENIDVIICIDSHHKDQTDKIKEIINRTGTDNISIAFEPTVNTTIDNIKEELKTIKDELKQYSLSYIYGSNIDSKNFREYKNELDVDGFLISKHALNVEELKTIVKIAESED